MKKTNKAVALLATLGIASGGGLANSSLIQEVAQSVAQFQILTTSEQATGQAVFAQIDELTKSLNQLNETIEAKLGAINTAELQQLEMLKIMLDLSFDLMKKSFSEEELRTSYYHSARPFSSSISRLYSLITIRKDQLGLIKHVHYPELTLTAEQFEELSQQVSEYNNKRLAEIDGVQRGASIPI